METKNVGQPATSDPETSTASTEKAKPTPLREHQKKHGRKKNKKPGGSGVFTSITISLSNDFVRKLKGVSSLLNEPVSEYVESRLVGPLDRDLKKALGDLA